MPGGPSLSIPPSGPPVGHQGRAAVAASLCPPGQLLPSKAGASGEAGGPGARRLTVRSLSVPPRWFSMQVYTVEPGGRGSPGLCWPQSTWAAQHRATHARLRAPVRATWEVVVMLPPLSDPERGGQVTQHRQPRQGSGHRPLPHHSATFWRGRPRHSPRLRPGLAQRKLRACLLSN